MTDGVQTNDRTHLEKLRLAVEVLLREGGEISLVTDALESELVVLRDSLERLLLAGPDES